MKIEDKEKKVAFTMSKGSALIHIDSTNVTTYQRRIINALIYIVKRDCEININTRPFVTTLPEIKKLTGISNTNNQEIKKALYDLHKKDIEYNIIFKDKSGLQIDGVMSYINNPHISYNPKDGFSTVKFDVPHQILSVINRPKKDGYFTFLDLFIIKGLKNKFSIALYEVAKDYFSIGEKELDIKDFKRLIGVGEKYERWNMFVKRVLDPALKDVNDNSDINIKYSIKKTGRNISKITLYMVNNQPTITLNNNNINKIPQPNSTIVQDLIEMKMIESEAIKAQNNYDEEYIRTKIECVKDEIEKGIKKGNPIENVGGFLNKALKDNITFKSEKVIEEENKKSKNEEINKRIKRFREIQYSERKRHIDERGELLEVLRLFFESPEVNRTDWKRTILHILDDEKI